MPLIRVIAERFAPALTRVLTISALSLKTAQCNAVIPSPCAALTSAPCFNRLRTAGRSPFIAASATRDSTAPAWINALVPSPSARQMNKAAMTLFFNIASPPLNGELSGAITEGFRVDAHSAQQREIHIRHRRSIGRHKVQITFQRTVAVAGQEDRATFVIVQVAVAHRGAVQNEGVIEQVAVSVWSLLQLLQEIRNLADVIPVDLTEVLNPLRIAAMMRRSMKCSADTTLGPYALGNIARHLESRYASDTRGEREYLQI